MQLSSILYGGLLVLQIITMNMLFSDYASDYHAKFEEKRLQIAVNYAVDAAAKRMRETSDDLGQDYNDLTKFNVDPTIALETFSAILAKNYDVPLNPENMQSVLLDYVPVFMVVTNDGYYVTSRHKVNDFGVENMIFSPKLPYSTTYTEVNGTTSIFSYNLSLTSAIKVDSTGGVFKVDNPPLTTKEQSSLINNRISDVLNEHLIKSSNGDSRGMIYIPSEVTELGSTNTIRDTTVFAYIDNFDLAGYGMDLQSFGIGGANITPKKTVVGFTVGMVPDIQKYYVYSDELPAGATIVELFDSQEAAAQEGYYFYVK
jgi:hypothetical protein